MLVMNVSKWRRPRKTLPPESRRSIFKHGKGRHYLHTRNKETETSQRGKYDNKFINKPINQSINKKKRTISYLESLNAHAGLTRPLVKGNEDAGYEGEKRMKGKGNQKKKLTLSIVDKVSFSVKTCCSQPDVAITAS